MAPYDKAAYHALVNVGIVQQDLKMVFLMSMIGRKAVFFSHIYGYDLPQAVEAVLDFWQDKIFNPTRERAGLELRLNVVGCDGEKRIQSLPQALTAVDLPQEALTTLASKKVRVNFQQFKNLDDARFQNRVFQLVSQATRPRRGGDGKPVVLTLKDGGDTPAGLLQLDLSVIDLLGHEGRVPFRLRLARAQWHSYFTDTDRRKKLLLPVGNYYLKVNKRVVKAFTVHAGQTAQVKVDLIRR